MAFWQFTAVPQQWPDVLYALVTDYGGKTQCSCVATVTLFMRSAPANYFLFSW